MSIIIPGIDVEKGLELYGGELDFYVFALRSWFNNTPPVLDVLRNISAETLDEYIIKIHGVKGTSAHIGAEEIREKAAKLEELAKAGDLEGVLALNEPLIKQVEALLEIVKDWLEKNAPEE